MRKSICLFLVVIMFFTSSFSHFIFADEDLYDNEEYELNNLKRLMAEDNLYNPNDPSSSLYQPTIAYKTRTLYFNMELYNDKAIPVYGDYQDVIDLDNENDFSIPKAPIVGYYLNGSLRGEYRAHSYTYDKRLYLNSSNSL